MLNALMRLTVVGVALMLVLPAVARAADGEQAALEQGKAILAKNCARCHGIGKSDASKHEQAPPFRDVMKRYPAENLAEALAEGIVSGHPDMPEFTFEPNEIGAIVTYLDSLRTDGAN